MLSGAKKATKIKNNVKNDQKKDKIDLLELDQSRNNENVHIHHTFQNGVLNVKFTYPAPYSHQGSLMM